MTESPSERDPVEALVDEFALRVRRGEFPSVSEYAARHPEHADRIEGLFPTVALMERLRAEEKSRHETASRRCDLPALPEQLGDFRIIREIGRGGMGIVYEAEQKSLGRRVAVKVLPRHVLLIDKHLQRFQREAQTAARLQHTNIVPVFGAGQQDGLHYYVMPLVRGVGLDEIIRALGASRVRATHREAHNCGEVRFTHPTPRFAKVTQSLIAEKFPDEPPQAGPVEPDRWRAAARIGLQAAEALAYAHSHGTLHRDVKPGNLLVDAEGVVSVADFGLARAVDHADVSRSGEVVGTLRYMAPEQLRGNADPRSDVYGLGLTLYELVALRPAFEDSERRRCLKSHRADVEPVPLRRIDPAIPRDLETILLKCLAAEPSRRYQTAAALAADLERFLDDRPIRARRVSAVERVWRWCRRNRALAAMSALAAVLLIAVTVTAATGYVHTRMAYSRASAALARAEATSQLALDVLDDIYLHLSPDRARIASDADPGGDACTCVGLRSGGGSASPAERAAQQVQASRETATLLKDLLVFYDRLAEQDGSDRQLTLESAIAGRRVGDIHQRLGQLDEAEAEYAQAVEKLAALAASFEPRDANAAPTRPPGRNETQLPLSEFIDISTELARCQNELGNVASARFDVDRAYDAHRRAYFILQPLERNDALPADCRFELARTLYFLASKQPSGVARRRGLDLPEQSTSPRLNPYKTNQLRTQAIEILDRLAREHPGAPDYRFLLALCYRPAAFGPYAVTTAAGAEGRRKAIRILEELKAQYPGVVDYRYELAVTYAWIHVGLFPWQHAADDPAEAEASLRAALAESKWLVDHNPTIPDYARAQTLILAKLGMVCRRMQKLDEAEDLLQQAIRTQESVVADFPDLPPQNRVLLEFVRLRAAEVSAWEAAEASDPARLGPCREQLQTCVKNLTDLTKTPKLADDRLAWSSLPVAYEALSQLLDGIGEGRKAEELAMLAKTIRSEMPDGRQDAWQ